MLRRHASLVLAFLVVTAAGAWAQGNPTGAITGQVLDPDNLALPGVTITVASAALQGTRSTVTSANGDYLIPFLPAGEYEVTFQLEGFQIQRQRVTITMAATLPVNAKLALAALAEQVTVTAQASEIVPTATLAANYKAETLQRLPVGRALNDAVLLAPGVAPNGPSNNIQIAGALSFESLYLVNGVVVNENLRGQALNLFIEDAIQETKVSAANISAEYGRFGGGVVNTITKSGGNRFSGSFRTTFNNDAWRALTPYPTDQTVNKITPMYEGTLGGPIMRDRIWFFGAGRYTKPERNRTLDVTGINFTNSTDERRYEGKVTYALNQKNNVRASYMKRTTVTKNNWFGTVMDLASLYDNSTDQHLYTVNYTSVVRSDFFVEGQYSKKISATMDTGSRYSDLVKGTPIEDRSRNSYRYNSPTFCAVCGTGWLEHRDNWDWFVKGNYFLSTQRTGSHNVVIGFDNFKEWRKNNNWQSGSSYSVQGTSAIIQGSTIYPVFRNDNTTYINWMPLVADSVGNDIRTYSAYLNDTWRYNARVTLNIGARFDLNRSKDQSGQSVVRDSQWSPRVGLSWDLEGNGKWNLNAGFARYVSGISTALVDAGSAGGRTASYSWFYQGPAINNGADPYLTADQALPILWNWFFANGGNNRATRQAPSIPGVSTKVRSDVTSPSSNEYSVGIANERGKASWRLDYVYRKALDQYGDFLDLETGRVSDPTGRQYDLTQVGNSPKAKRTYNSLIAMFNYRLPSWQVGGNYTLSKMWGNTNGENTGSGPIRAGFDTYPEYRQEPWNYPMGYSPGDQRHKLKAWLMYAPTLPKGLGRIDIGILQRYDSAIATDISGSVDVRSWVTNPGYLNPPSSFGYYFFPRGSFRWDPVWNTDLSVSWGKKLRPAGGGAELFFRGVITNALNRHGQVSGDTTINTRVNNSAYTSFNPFATTPAKGTNWDYGQNFGKPTSPTDYQAARTFSFSIGIRF